MATVASVITSGRYDLRDSSELKWSDAELLDYLNRALIQLDNALSANNSDWVYTEDTTTTLSEDGNSVSVPTGTIVVRDVWIGSDRLFKQDPPVIMYKRQFVTSERQPYHWAHQGANIIFEATADTDYSLEIYYDKRATALTSVGDMPYSDEFNGPLRQMMVFCAKNRDEFDVNIDAQMYNFFLDSALGNTIKRTYINRKYRLDY